MSEAPEHRLKRLRLRSMRRGIKEMDLILTGFADARLASLAPGELEMYDTFLSENDHDLYQWVTGQTPPPDQFAGLVAQISELIGIKDG